MRSDLRNSRVKLPNVDRRAVRGTVYKYHRVTRAKLPTDVPEDHPRFIAAWTAEEAKSPDASPRIDGAPGTIAAACRRFLGSNHYQQNSPDYRRVIRRHVEEIARAYGSAVFRQLRAKHIATDLGRLPTSPARQRRKAWRQLCAWALAEGIIEEDPSGAVKTPRAPKTDGFIPWSRDEIEAFRSYWAIATPQRLAFELTYWTAARRSNVCRLSRRMIASDGVLVFKQVKTGNPAHVPMTCALPAYADRASHAYLMACIDEQKPEMMFIVTQSGKPRSQKAFGAWLSEAAAKAGVEGRTAHGLRKSRLTQIAEDGGTVHAIMSWGGHVTLSEAQRYIESANRKRAVMGNGLAINY